MIVAIHQPHSENWESLSDLNIFLIEQLGTALGLDPKPCVKASDFELSDDPTNRLVDICKKLKADTYLFSG
ncbi:MAG: WbqC family protein [bacterium]|nr:WbqC family protein [bacterium]